MLRIYALERPNRINRRHSNLTKLHNCTYIPASYLLRSFCRLLGGNSPNMACFKFHRNLWNPCVSTCKLSNKLAFGMFVWLMYVTFLKESQPSSSKSFTSIVAACSLSLLGKRPETKIRAVGKVDRSDVIVFLIVLVTSRDDYICVSVLVPT